MPVTISERFDSREATVGDSPTVDLLYVVQGTDDDGLVKATVAATAPANYQGLVPESIHVTPLGGGIWEASVRYGKSERKETGDSSFSFDTGGGTQHITQSLETVGVYPNDAPSYLGAIGASSDSVEGTDVTVPVYNFAETHYVADDDVDNAYKGILFQLTGKLNDGPFKGFAAGEVLFLGASGSKRGTDDWEITFRFAASPNKTDLFVGPLGPISKRGWDYLWVRYADEEDQHALVKQPQAVYVERVYDEGDFAGLGIGT